MREQFNERIEYFLSLLNKEMEYFFDKELFNNPLFIISDTSNYNYLYISFYKEKCVEFSIYIDSDGIGFNIDRVGEAMEWNTEYLKGNSLHCFLKDLFGCFIKVFYFGNDITEILFFNSVGEPIRKIVKRGLFYFKLLKNPSIYVFQSIIN